MMKITDLTAEECGPLTKIYTPLVGEEDFFTEMEKSTIAVIELFSSIPVGKYTYRYAPSKWTILETLQHLIDVERIFAYRILCFARGEKGALVGFEVDDYATASLANNRKMADLLAEFKAVRESTRLLFQSFDATMLQQIGTASGTQNSVRALGFRLIGHDWHHLQLIRERYL